MAAEKGPNSQLQTGIIFNTISQALLGAAEAGYRKCWIIQNGYFSHRSGGFMPLKLVPILLLVLFLLGCSENSASVSSPQHSSEASFLVFFLDPNGRPCQMQDAILKDMAAELEGIVKLRYVSTTVPADLDYFYSFGIRGLPALLLADASGKEIRRLPPGVRSAEEIRGLLRFSSGK
jgi:thioredoxin 1